MKKIQISPELMGTPLTEQELKSIVGGNLTVVRTCHCTFTFTDGSVTSKTFYNITSEGACSEKCQGYCDEDLVNCKSNTFKYTVEG